MNKLAEKALRMRLPGYEDKYEIDEHGNVHNILKDVKVSVDTSNPHGYHRVNLFGLEGRKRVFVHRIVNQAFSGDQWDPSKVVDHIDGNKVNNHHLNLRGISQSENTLAAIALGLRVYGGNNEAAGSPEQRIS